MTTAHIPSGTDVLVWGPAAEGEVTASGNRVRAGWVWTCVCGAWGHGYPTEDAADEAAGRPHLKVLNGGAA